MPHCVKMYLAKILIFLANGACITSWPYSYDKHNIWYVFHLINWLSNRAACQGLSPFVSWVGPMLQYLKEWLIKYSSINTYTGFYGKPVLIYLYLTLFSDKGFVLEICMKWNNQSCHIFFFSQVGHVTLVANPVNIFLVPHVQVRSVQLI